MNLRLRILAVCSGGGHWIQMQRLTPALAGHRVTFATVKPSRRRDENGARILSIPDANRDTKIRLIWLLIKLLWIFVWCRPQVILTTGAAPGYLAIRLGRLFGKRTLFLDSIANAERLSLSARLALPHADVTLTQWPDLADESGPEYQGTVL